MKYLIVIIIAFLTQAITYSQDHIITKTGKDLEVNITEIRQSDITFTLYNDTTNTPYVMDKEEIDKIVFENGSEESFGNRDNETIINNNNTNRSKEPDKIYTTDGKVIYCEVVERKRFGVNYIPVNNNNNYLEYLANTKIDRIEYANGDVVYISGSPKNAKNRKDPKDFTYLSPHYISIATGPAIPFGIIGNLGATSSTASTGIMAEVDATYYLFRGMGFNLAAGYMWNPYIGTQQDQLALSQIPNTATDISIQVDDWHNHYVTAGLGYYNEYGRLLIDYRAMFGAFFSYYPKASATYTDGGITQTSVYTDQSTSFIFGGQISARYFLTRKFQLKLNASTMFGRAEFDGIIRRDYQNGQQVSESVAGQLAPINLSWVNISFGIAYTLGK